MDTISLIGIIVIAILQLTYIFVQHIFYNKKINELKEGITTLEIQLNDKVSVINELQKYSTNLVNEMTSTAFDTHVGP